MKPDLIERLKRWLAPLGEDLPPLYLVGGALRDRFMGRPVKDIDLMCAAPEPLARRMAAHHGAALVSFLTKAEAPCFRVVRREDAGDVIDLVPLRGPDPEADLMRRDFTINAMAMAVGPRGRLGALLDPLGGRRDLAGRRIRAASATAFADDPLRILRAVRFAAQLDFVMDEAMDALMARSAPALAGVAGERIWTELRALLTAPQAVLHLVRLDRVGALTVIFPEIAAMKGCTQNTHHHLDVWEHSLAALAACEAILSAPESHFGSSAPAVRSALAGDHRFSLLKLAVLLHDSGKPLQRRVDPASGRVFFHGHDRQGARLVKAVGERLRLSAREAAFVTALTAHHMHILALSDPSVRPATVLRWCRRLGDACVAALILSMADVAATRGPAADPAWRQRHLSWAGRTVEEYLTVFKPRLEAPPLVTGRDLVGLGLAPGPELGRILAVIRDAQQTEKIQTREAALDMAAALCVRASAAAGSAVSRKPEPA